jgi:hypothetical protein
VNENRFFNGYPDDIESNLAMLDKHIADDAYVDMERELAAALPRE